MTGPIKPPGASGAPYSPPEPGPSVPRSTGFQAPLEQQEVARASENDRATPVAGGASAAPLSELAELAARVKAGELSPDAAVEGLVQRALRSPMAAGLGAAGRADLEAHLRSTLSDDPVFGQMLRDLGRSV